jgi:lipoate-protein ligase A
MDQDRLFITSQNDDPAFNLAAEEVLLRTHKESIIFFYINRPSIIVGKHQNTLSEINHEYLVENKIPVYRRLSGGGTVYHDHGNINYCIIENGEPGRLVDFVRATTPIVEALKSYGINARHGKRNDLLAGYKKISGNACHVYKSRAMHHGTLLFDANLGNLTEGLKADPLKFKDKSVKSVRSEVINISELSDKHHSSSDFLNNIVAFLIRYLNGQPYNFSKEDIQRIEKLKAEKYDTWQWNYGYSPVYEFSKRSKRDGYIYSSKLKVVKGKITEIDIKSNYPDQSGIQKAKEILNGSLHNKKLIRQSLEILEKEISLALMDCLF